LLALAGLATPACSQQPASRPQPSDAARGDSIIVALQAAPRTLLEPFSTLDDELHIGSLIASSLTNLELRDELIHTPGLAHRWEWSPDGKEITYHLRDAKWDDGAPIRASDVVFTYRLIGDERANSVRREYVSRIEKVEALDDKRVKFTFKTAYYRESQLSDSGECILPEHIYGKLDPQQLYGTDLALAPVGHGPFRVVEHQGNEAFVLERNEAVTTAGVPYLARAIFLKVGDYDARYRKLLAGEIDAMDGIRPEDLEAIQKRGEFDLYDRGQRFVDFVAWNQKRELFQDARVRRALTLAIDREGMIAALLTAGGKVYGKQPIGTVPPVLRSAYADDLKLLPFDPAASEKLLDEAGWTRPSPGAMRARDGKPLAFTLLVNDETPRRRQTARMIQQDLKKVGIAVEVDSMRFDVLQKRMDARDYDAAIYGFSASLQMKQGDTWTTGSAFNFGAYSSPKVDKIAAEISSEMDSARLRNLLKDMQRQIYEDQPYTFLCWFSRFAVVRNRFRNFGANELGFTIALEGCYVPKALQKTFPGR